MRALALVLLVTGCAHGPATRQAEGGDMSDWRKDLDAWRKQRAESIGGELGWITLAGLSWLSEGENRVGGDATLEVPLPADHAPPRVGSVFLEGERVRFVPAAGVDVRIDGRPATAGPLVEDGDGRRQPTVITTGPLTMFVIRRHDRFALRVKDREHPARRTFRGLDYYPLAPSLHVQAHLDPAPAGRTIPIVNVLGYTEAMPTPGTLRFRLDGVDYALDAVLEPGERELFVLFKDATAGHGTYPAGRFLYAPAPAADGSVDLDFNRAFTPPCGFTTFATCPIPPRQNVISRRIEAGERYEGHGE